MWRQDQSADPVTWLIVGLGNPGVRYQDTRHNVGWWVLDELAARWGAAGTFAKHQSLAQQCHHGGQRVLLIRPQTYMNLSGQAVKAWLKQYPAAAWLVVYDDVAVLPGELRLKRSGSAGGHNGVASLIQALGKQQFDRIKVGIGKPPEHANQADYVLGVPPAAESELIKQAVSKAAEAVELAVKQGFDSAAQMASGGLEKQEQRRRERQVRLAQSAQTNSRREVEPNPPQAEDPGT